MLQSLGVFSLPCLRVLDLFCGSGALAIESLSRGAQHATLAAAVNLRHLGCTDSRVLRLCVFELLLAPQRFLAHDSTSSNTSTSSTSSNTSTSNSSSMHGCTPFDLVFVCPPYTEVVYGDLLEASPTAAASPAASAAAACSAAAAPAAAASSAGTASAAAVLRLLLLASAAASFAAAASAASVSAAAASAAAASSVLLLRCHEKLLFSGLLKAGSLVVVEFPRELGCLPLEIGFPGAPLQLEGLRNRRYGRTCVALYVARSPEDKDKKVLCLSPADSDAAGDNEGDAAASRETLREVPSEAAIIYVGAPHEFERPKQHRRAKKRSQMQRQQGEQQQQSW
ncbi:hypothetical protein ACSSS7_008222 [Eimeria intestinalis]